MAVRLGAGLAGVRQLMAPMVRTHANSAWKHVCFVPCCCGVQKCTFVGALCFPWPRTHTGDRGARLIVCHVDCCCAQARPLTPLSVSARCAHTHASSTDQFACQGICLLLLLCAVVHLSNLLSQHKKQQRQLKTLIVHRCAKHQAIWIHLVSHQGAAPEHR